SVSREDRECDRRRALTRLLLDGRTVKHQVVARTVGANPSYHGSGAESRLMNDAGRPDVRLSLIPTRWSLIDQAHHGPSEAAKSAREELLRRYEGAVKRYLRKVMRSDDDADEVFQEFAFRVLHGDLRGADPKRGRFRDFVKGTLFHLIAD